MTLEPLAGRRRLPEHGRIRLGHRKSARVFEHLEHFRFTSPDLHVLEELAALYGGKPKPWHDDRASPRDQFQLYSEVNRIPVTILRGGLSVWYELWSQGGVLRRCDGITCTSAAGETPCICDRKGVEECRPTTRLAVIITEVTFGGVWRLDSKGWNALQELSAMEKLLFTMTDSMLLRAELGFEKRSKVKDGKTSHFVVPWLRPMTSLDALMTGQADVKAIASADRLALPEAPPPTEAAAVPADAIEVVAEVVDAPPLDYVAPEKGKAEPISFRPLRQSLEEASQRIMEAHPISELDAECQLVAAELRRARPDLFAATLSDDEVLNLITLELSKNKKNDWTTLDDTRKERLSKRAAELIDEATP